jgi:predicted signal transduction protein with EAL and GGDEF domain
VQVDTTALDLDSCLAQADEGSRQAKALGGDRCVVLDEGQSAEVLRRRRMLRDLEQAINEGQVEPYFQPVVSLVTGEPQGFELLFRTSAPGLQEASVYDCIVMAEDSGLIHRLGLGVLRFATLSDGKVFEPVNAFRKNTVKLAKYQRCLSRKTKFSSNWKKQKQKIKLTNYMNLVKKLINQEILNLR